MQHRQDKLKDKNMNANAPKKATHAQVTASDNTVTIFKKGAKPLNGLNPDKVVWGTYKDSVFTPLTPEQLVDAPAKPKAAPKAKKPASDKPKAEPKGKEPKVIKAAPKKRVSEDVTFPDGTTITCSGKKLFINKTAVASKLTLTANELAAAVVEEYGNEDSKDKVEATAKALRYVRATPWHNDKGGYKGVLYAKAVREKKPNPEKAEKK